MGSPLGQRSRQSRCSPSATVSITAGAFTMGDGDVLAATAAGTSIIAAMLQLDGRDAGALRERHARALPVGARHGSRSTPRVINLTDYGSVVRATRSSWELNDGSGFFEQPELPPRHDDRDAHVGVDSTRRRSSGVATECELHREGRRRERRRARPRSATPDNQNARERDRRAHRHRAALLRRRPATCSPPVPTGDTLSFR